MELSQNATIHYKDDQVEIVADGLIIHKYYFPTMAPKYIRFDQIDSIRVAPLTLLNGKWRIHGTGNVKTWFPWDRHRPSRDRAFFVTLRGKWVEIGLTVENEAEVESIFRTKGLLQ
jgi:hypothetical protein